MHSPSEMPEDSESQLRQFDSQARAPDNPCSLALNEHQVQWPLEPLSGQNAPHVLRSLTSQVDRLLAAADDWGFDTI